MTAFVPEGAIALANRPAVRTAPRIEQWPDPDVIAVASDLLRELADASAHLTDALDVAGFPPRERHTEVALLSTLASGMPAITLKDVVDALRHLAVTSGPAALFPDALGQLSLPDEARELLYVVSPLVALASGRRRLPRHAGERLRGSPLAFSITQAPVCHALEEVALLLEHVQLLPLTRPALTTIRRVRVRRPVRRPVRRAEPTRAEVAILLGTLLLALLVLLAVAALVNGSLSLPFDPRRLLP